MVIDKIISNIKSGVAKIPAHYQVVLENLEESEGGYLHRNTREKDITTSHGIYRRRHGTAMIFKYIDSLAKQVTTKPSSSWTKAEIKKIDKLIDPDVELYLTYMFYKRYLDGARLHLFHKDVVVLMANLYTNSPEGAWMSVQEALIDMHEDDLLATDRNKLSIVDGDYGRKTKNAVLLLQDAGRLETIIFKKCILLAMKSYYIDLAVGNPGKFFGNLKGWDNRIEDNDNI